MLKLAIGDRVMVYGWVQMHHSPYQPRGGGRATVIHGSGEYIYVKFQTANNGELNGDQSHYLVHPKQCRRLVKKPMRIIYLERASNGEGYSNFNSINGEIFHQLKPGERVEFIEVRKK